MARLEAGSLTLEESVALYEEGMRLTQICGQLLDAADLRVSRLATGAGGQNTEVPLESEEREA